MPHFLGSQQLADELWALRNGNEDCANFVETPTNSMNRIFTRYLIAIKFIKKKSIICTQINTQLAFYCSNEFSFGISFFFLSTTSPLYTSQTVPYVVLGREERKNC